MDRKPPRPIYPSDLAYALREALDYLRNCVIDEATWTEEERHLIALLEDTVRRADGVARTQDEIISAAVAFTTLWRPGERPEDHFTQVAIVSMMNMMKKACDQFVEATGGIPARRRP